MPCHGPAQSIALHKDRSVVLASNHYVTAATWCMHEPFVWGSQVGCYPQGLNAQQCISDTMRSEQCSLFLPLRWGAGSMALMLWLNW
jgi:hypothetical protein